MRFKCFLVLLCWAFFLSAGYPQNAAEKVRSWRTKNEDSLLAEYMRFLSIPNVARDTVNIRKNASFILNMMQQRGIRAELLESGIPGVSPVVFGSIRVPGAKQTLAFYAHYDGQPVNPGRWAAGLDPFTPVYLNAPVEQGGKVMEAAPGEKVDPSWRISGRGSADDKAGVMTIINAAAALQQSGLPLKNNILFFFEGEEEMGSPHIADFFEKYRQKLQADLWIIADGPRHVSGNKSIVFGVRGDVNLSLTVYGPKRPLHSGNYGNWAPNPARLLTALLAGMTDTQGKITIPGFYEDVIPLTETEKKAIANIPGVEEDLRKELGIALPDGNGRPFNELLLLPTLNINGIRSADVGELAANVIPTKAEATLDLRLVLGNDMKRQIQKVTRYIESKGYHIIDHDPTDPERMTYPLLIKITSGAGYNAQRTPMDLPIARSLVQAVQTTIGYPAVLIPSAGGSLPLIVFEEKLGAKVITVPVVNYDNNQHAENENVRIDFLWEGIETMVAIMQMQ